MTTTVNIHEAKTHLSKLIQRVRLGEEVVIAKAGEPVARLVPEGNQSKPRSPGTGRGDFVIHDSFYEPLPANILDLFEGKLGASPKEHRRD